ncbi:MAG: 2-amino-4-hydroxy-6-hydroxymethyldihydropteridine diphosphokinase [Hyphomicrobiales bacterium]
MILLGLGSNLPGPWGPPADMLAGALEALEREGIRIALRSGFLLSAPLGRTAQPEFANAVVAVETYLPPLALLARCHRIERLGGRRRHQRWGPRTLDIDLLAYHGVIMNRGTGSAAMAARAPLVLPHPGIEQRAFVLVPLEEIAPGWHHPVTGQSPSAMLRRLGVQRQGAVLGSL